MLITDPVALAPWFQLKSSWQSIVAGGYTQIMSADPTRTCIIFSGDFTAGGIMHVNILPQAVNGLGIRFEAGTPPLILSMQDVGGLTQHEWYASPSVGGGVLAWMETFYRPNINLPVES